MSTDNLLEKVKQLREITRAADKQSDLNAYQATSFEKNH